MNMKFVGFLILFISLYQLSSAQLKEDSYVNDSKISSTMTVGSTFGNNFSGTFLAPNINQTINSKLSLNYGGIFAKNSSSFMIVDGYGFGYAMPSSSNTFYVDGTYRLSEKITLKSTVVLANNNFDGYGQDLQNFNSNMYTMGIEYKITDGFRIQAEIGMGQGQYPYSHLFNQNNLRSIDHGISPFYSPLFGY